MTVNSRKDRNGVKRHITTAAKIVVSLGLIVFLFWRMDLAQVAETLRNANYWYLLPAALLFLAAMSNAGLKWFVLLRAQGIEVPFRAVLSYTFVGFFFNNFLPANVGGDIMRGYGLARYTEQVAEAAVSIVVDRLVGLLGFMLAAVVSAVVAVFVLHNQNLEIVAIAAVAAVVVLGIIFAVLLSRRVRALVARIFDWRLLNPLAPTYQRLSSSLDAYRHNYSALLLALCLGVLTLILTNFTDYFIAQALGGGMPLIYIFLFNPIIAFVLLVPISIGGLGVTQAAYPFFYGLAGVSTNLAFAVSLMKQLIIYVTSIPGGILWWRGKAGAGQSN
jgi:glycosyltransferase 2 family protein